jgi:uncharacterized membrane protein (DUF373 family)
MDQHEQTRSELDPATSPPHQPLSKEVQFREAVITWLDRFFSLIVLLVILLLATYSAIVLWMGSQEMFVLLFSGIGGEERQLRMMHAVARTIIVLKAYRILISYLRTHHVTVKYMLEIAFVACVVELFFAYDLHDFETKIVFAVFGLVGVALYLYFYEGRGSDRPADRSQAPNP